MISVKEALAAAGMAGGWREDFPGGMSEEASRLAESGGMAAFGPPELRLDGERRMMIWRGEGFGACLCERAGRFAALGWEEGKKEPCFLTEGPVGMLDEDVVVFLGLAREGALVASRESQPGPERPAWESW